LLRTRLRPKKKDERHYLDIVNHKIKKGALGKDGGDVINLHPGTVQRYNSTIANGDAHGRR